jgi:hypothetical protein
MFDRWTCGWSRTWCYRLFKEHHTQLNMIYWAYAPAAAYVLKQTRGTTPNLSPAQFFPVRAADERRVDTDLAAWKEHFKEFANWVRLSAAVSLTSYLEIYLRSAVTLALESDPGVMLGAPRAIDGIALLKAREDYSYADASIPVVKGTWQQRVGKYVSHFGMAPPELSNAIGELDKLRVLRNSVGHAFGREMNIFEARVNLLSEPMRRLSEKRLMKWLGLVDGVVTSVDNHLRTTHIGAYEVLCCYHNWDHKYEAARITEAAAFKGWVHSHAGDAPSKQYFQDMITYYNVI